MTLGTIMITSRQFRGGVARWWLLALLAAVLALPVSPVAAQTPPAAPGFAFAVNGRGDLHVFWQSVSGATKYEVAYSSDGGAAWTSHADNLTGTRVSIQGINYTISYVARVRAGNDNGWSAWKVTNATEPWSDEKVVTLPIDEDSRNKLRSAQAAANKTGGSGHGQPAPALTPPPYIDFEDVTETTATLKVVNNSLPWSYKRDSGSCSATQSSSTTSVGLTGLTANTTYQYRVWDNGHCSGSPMAMGTLRTTPAPHVTNLHSTDSLTLVLPSDPTFNRVSPSPPAPTPAATPSPASPSR